MSQSLSSAIDTNRKSDSTRHEPTAAGASSNQLEPLSHVDSSPRYATSRTEKDELDSSIRPTNRCQATLPSELGTDANSSSHSKRCNEREPMEAKSNDLRANNDHQTNTDELNLIQTNRQERPGRSDGANQKKTLPIGWTDYSSSQSQSGSQSNSSDCSELSMGASNWMATGSDSPARASDSTVDSGIKLSRQVSATSGLRGAGHPKRNLATSLSMPCEVINWRRRSSVAFTPQMQVCPGDLLVDDWQLNDLMNQSDENDVSCQTATIKKARSHIWSPFKLCLHLENRTIRMLSRLEDVFSSHKPCYFIDEQLSQYKGMPWNEFLCKIESQLSSKIAANYNADNCSNQDENEIGTSTTSTQRSLYNKNVSTSSFDRHQREQSDHTQPASIKTNKTLVSIHQHLSRSATRQPVNESMSGSTGRIKHTLEGRTSSRIDRKPKLERGQTVDSLFRVSLISSSSFKHALRHQETPTSYLEDQTSKLISAGKHEGLSVSPRSSTSSNTDLADPSRHFDSRIEARTNSKRIFVKENTYKSSFEAVDALVLTNRGEYSGKFSLSTLSSNASRNEQKRQLALWDLFQSECVFFFDHLMTLKNVYMEPLKLIQVEGIAMFAQPDVLFGNLDELCCGVYDFCKEFLNIIIQTLENCPENLNTTEVLIMMYKNNMNINRLRTLYQEYTLKYIKALTHLECLRRHKEFVEFEKFTSDDPRCNKLHLTDLLVAPVQHIMRVPIILREIESHSENRQDREEIKAILAVEESFLRKVDDKMKWLKNFERLREIQKNIIWPSVLETEPKFYVPETLREVLKEQPCQNLMASPRRRIVQEGTLAILDVGGKPIDLHLVLFEDMLLMLRMKESLIKRASTICKTNFGATSTKNHGSPKYIVYRQPLSLDRFRVYDSQDSGSKYLFMLVVSNRFKQIINAYTFSAPDEETKQTWLVNLKETADRFNTSPGSSNSS